MADNNYTDIYYDSESEKEGIEIRGKDAVFLNSPAVLLAQEIELPTESRDLIEILNELFRSGGEGGDGNLKIIDDNGSDLLVIGIEKVVEEETIISGNNYTYEKTTFTESITFYKTIHQTQETSTIVKTFSKSIITKISDPYGTQIFCAECDSKGNVLNYFDADYNKIEVIA